tara:strand:- start:271 stop:1428 length:1158 start_codon:yes stop_codon:yes gene_type:complete
MGLLQQTQQQYYDVKKSFTGDGTTLVFIVSNSQSTFPTTYNNSNTAVYIDNVLIIQNSYSLLFTAASGWHIDFAAPTGAGTAYGAPASGANIVIDVESNFGSYQYITLSNVINNFIISYVGRDKVISSVDRVDVAFHAQRALQELSYDTLKSVKSQEIEVPASLTMILPQDYINYVKLAWKDSAGIERVIYPVSKTSNPNAIKQDSDGNYSFDIDDDTSVLVDDRDDTTNLINNNNSDTWNSYKAATPSKNQDDYQDDTYWPAGGERYGLDPQHAQANGSFFIDEIKGLIHFSSNISGKTIILKYISDGLGTDEEMILHKLAEEAMYKWIAYAVLSTRINTPEHIVQRFKKEKFAETRKAKLRLSNIKLEELTQTLRGKSKHIKH